MATVQINDELFRELERLAAQSGRPVEAIVEDAIRAYLQRFTPPSDERGGVMLPRLRQPTASW